MSEEKQKSKNADVGSKVDQDILIPVQEKQTGKRIHYDRL